MDKINYEALKASVSSIAEIKFDARGEGYLKSYPIYLEFFKSSNFETSDDFTIRAGIVYSWMPRIMVVDDKCIQAAVNSIRRFIDLGNVEKKDEIINDVSTALNGSYIGASKLLHFQFPDIFPIYDTRVYKHINGILDKNKQVYSKANKLQSYKIYIKSIEEIINLPNSELEIFEPVSKYFLHNYGYSVSKIRAIEFVVFSNYCVNNA